MLLINHRVKNIFDILFLSNGTVTKCGNTFAPAMKWSNHKKEQKGRLKEREKEDFLFFFILCFNKFYIKEKGRCKYVQEDQVVFYLYFICK